MRKSNQFDSVLLEDPPSQQHPTFPSRTPGRPSAFKEALTELVDRSRVLWAKCQRSIKSRPQIAVGAGIGLIVVIALGVWLLHRSRPAVPANPHAAEIERLENLARNAYKSGHYVLPVDTSSLAYSKRVLRLDPSNNYSRTILENSVSGGKYQVQQALKRKDFAQARRLANTMAQLLPGRKDVAELKQDIRIAERGGIAPGRQRAAARQKAAPRQKAARTVTFSAYHLHGDKAPASRGPYCLGILSVNGGHLKFSGKSASRGQKVHKFNLACSDIREIKKNGRIASRQGGFHVRTASATLNFMPRDSSRTHISAAASACSN